jgi:hypothetical protein
VSTWLRFHRTGRIERKFGPILEKLSIRHLRVYLDPDGRLASSSGDSLVPLQLYEMPITYLVTPNGRIAGYISGPVDWLSNDAQRLLAYYAAA